METRKQTIPMQTRKAQFQPDSVNAEARTATMVWTTGAAVRRFDWWEGRAFYEELSLAEGHVHMDRLNNGAPLLNSHAQRDLSDIVGVVERAWIENGLGHAEVRFSERADVDPIFRDVQSGIIRNVSVGYMVHKYETVSEDENGVRTIRAVDWTPAELSLVPVPADAGAGIRSLPESDCEFVVTKRADSPKEPSMSQDTKAAQPAIETPEPKVDLDKIRAEAQAADRARSAEILKLCARHGMSDLSSDLIASGAKVEDVRAKILDELAERDAKAPTMPRIETVRDEVDTLRQGMEGVILYRAKPEQYKLDDNSRRFVGLSMLELARKSLDVAGIRHEGLNVLEVAGRAMHQTTDFPEILANVANKTLRSAYQAAPRTFTGWAKANTARDFKEISRTQMGDSPSLVQINEHGEYTYGTMGEMAEKYALATYGRIVAVTRQAIVNDDTSAFSRTIPSFGSSAAMLESDIVYGIVTANGNMSDGNALFHADHNNLDNAAVISVASLGVARARMRTQTSINGQRINVMPRSLLVPAALETIAQQFTSTAHMPDPATNINPFAGTLQVVAEPRLDASSNSRWYLIADPSQIDTVEYSYLEGSEGVYIETRNGWEIDGVEIKARHDFAAKAIDWRGMYRNG